MRETQRCLKLPFVLDFGSTKILIGIVLYLFGCRHNLTLCLRFLLQRPHIDKTLFPHMPCGNVVLKVTVIHFLVKVLFCLKLTNIVQYTISPQSLTNRHISQRQSRLPRPKVLIEDPSRVRQSISLSAFANVQSRVGSWAGQNIGPEAGSQCDITREAERAL